MKVKLLKAIRSEVKYKFKDGKCHLFMLSQISKFDSVSDMLKSYYMTQMENIDFLFSWDWHSIYFRYIHKLRQRKFNKI